MDSYPFDAAWLRRMVDAAFILGEEGRLNDPSDSDILIYAAESFDDDGRRRVDLSKLNPLVRRTIIDAYDRGTGL
jgi:hypothetical protein